jgi:hypothetical protein
LACICRHSTEAQTAWRWCAIYSPPAACRLPLPLGSCYGLTLVRFPAPSIRIATCTFEHRSQNACSAFSWVSTTHRGTSPHPNIGDLGRGILYGICRSMAPMVCPEFAHKEPQRLRLGIAWVQVRFGWNLIPANPHGCKLCKIRQLALEVRHPPTRHAQLHGC